MDRQVNTYFPRSEEGSRQNVFPTKKVEEKEKFKKIGKIWNKCGNL